MKLIFILLFWSIVVILLITRYIKSARTTEIRSQLEREFENKKESLESELAEKEKSITQREQAVISQEYSIKAANEKAQWAADALRNVGERESALEDIEKNRLTNAGIAIKSAIQQGMAEAEKSISEREEKLAEKEAAVKALELVILDRDRLSMQKLEDVRKSINRLKLQKEVREKLMEERKKIFSSNLSAIPYMADIIADFDTRGLEILAKKLDWGSNAERAKKVTAIRDLRKETQRLLAESKVAEYQLAYAIRMFPALEDFLETEYNQLTTVDFTDISSEKHDAVRSYLTKEEYAQLSTTDRNQLALDRYRNSHRKSNWQIGRDYEHYVGYKYTQDGYNVDYYGSTHGLEDLGRDLIAKKTDFPTLIIQCKYWSSKKTIHEKHINQLYGTMTCYCFENDIPLDSVRGVLVTNISISDTARRFSKYLGIEIVENFPLGEYPCIKCNINHDEYGAKTKIYHLPFDQQYDSCKIDKPGEFFAMTVAEAESAGFRRAFRWFA